ncbi:unnamed protein product [Rotaria magnacalcarata]|nr:unnamed protein product [Rotaria magnacalcarata]CAF1685626.1 unnamed protein product [Rotaria magnacalcarata]CAF5084927.1 unnamed protein product [Rotaria magnacalcarata]CAF5174531.1 unnamed protein product [Rotaria magnacalcarata]
MQSELTDRQVLMHYTQSSTILILGLVNTLNQLKFIQLAQTKIYHNDINKEINEIHLLEKEVLEQSTLLENISTTLGKVIIN